VDLEAADRFPAIGLHTSGRRLPLVLVHSWAGEAGHLQQLAHCLGSDQPIYGISPPRGDWPVDFPRTVEAWSHFCLATLRRLRKHGPYALGGWSFGGVVALTLAEDLAASGEEIRRVVMIDSRLPTKHPRIERNWVRKCLHHLDEALGKERGERLAYLRTKLGSFWKTTRPHRGRFLRRGTPVETKTRDVVMSHPLMRAIHTAYLRYEPFASTIPVSLFWTSESYGHMHIPDLTLGWGPYLRGAFESQAIPGTHVSLFNPPHVLCLADALRSTLDRLNRSATCP
jgi:thioesterase domain-containing protein